MPKNKLTSLISVKSWILKLLAPLLLCSASIETKRHIVIFQPSVDVVNATYLFGVENKSASDITYKLPIMMPKEKTNFRPQEGVTPEELVLGGDDHSDVWVQKVFKPSMNIIGFGYQVPAHFGEAVLTFTVPEPISELQIMVPDNLLVLKSEQMERIDNQGFAGKVFDSLRSVDLKTGSVIKVTVSGVPEGRTRYVMAGGLFILTLFSFAMFFAYKTKPRVVGNSDNELLV